MQRPSATDHQAINGHMWDNDVVVLQALMAGKRVLEIGTCTGKSTVGIAATAASVTTVDWGKGDEQMGAYLPALAQQSIYRYADPELVTCLVDDWVQLFQGLDLDYFQGIFYDAAHQPPYAYEADFLARAAHYKGLIALHDYKPLEEPMRFCVQAIDNFEKVTGRKRYGPLLGSSVVWFTPVR